MRAIALAVVAGCFNMPPRPQATSDDDGDAAVHDAAMMTGDATHFGGGDAAADVNLAFVSSITFQGNLQGLAGADLACSGLATAASLPGTYVAWLGTSTTSAASRLGSARGWVRLDGLPIVDTVAELTAGKILYPIAIDDGGDLHYDESVHVLTGTLAAGTASADTCNNYTSINANMTGTVGYSDATTGSWTNEGVALSCSTQNRIYCFETDKVTEVDHPPPPPDAKIAFLSTATTAAAGSLAAMDMICSSEATSAGLPGTFVALVATTTTSAGSRAATAIYARTDGVALGPIGNAIAAPFGVTATGAYVTAPAWTGAPNATTPVTSLGTVASTCNNWTTQSPLSNGTVGSTVIASASAYYIRTAACNDTSNHVYCVQQ